MKKLHSLITKQFFRTFIVTFVVVLFILLMQFIWLYIDDLAGKGLGTWVIVQMMFYFSASIIPQALPLSILLSSIMTFGNLGETYELVAAKAAGVSIWRIFAPLLWVMLGLALFGFFTSNVLIPQANLKKNSLLHDIRNQKPTILIQDGIFYNGIDGISIRVGKRDPKTDQLNNIVIYDQRGGVMRPVVITAEFGKMEMSADKRYLFFTLFNGARYEEMNKQASYDRTFPHTTFSFGEEKIVFDLQDFQFSRTDESLFKNHYQMLNIAQLNNGHDSLGRQLIVKQEVMRRNLDPYYHFNDSANSRVRKTIIKDTAEKILDFIPASQKANTVMMALNNARSAKGTVDYATNEIKDTQKLRAKYDIEWHKKFTVSVACIVMFFIGAPFGVIIRKGGFGMPVVISVLLYILYHIITITGEKMVKTESTTALQGMWLAVMILSPIGAFLTYQAANDSGLFDKSAWIGLFKKLFFIKSKK